MIQLKQLSLNLGTKTLLEKANLMLFAGDKVGIIGKNGAGKTSFFKLLLGQLHESYGELQLKKQRIAYLEQTFPQKEQLALEYVQSGDEIVYPYYQKLAKATQQQDGLQIAAIHHQIYQLNGYDLEARAAKIMEGLGFSNDQMLEEVRHFSGGWQRKLNLARVLTSNAEMLLLDEPTNHLDLDTIHWLIKWLQRYLGTLLIISHDRDFLDQTVNKIVAFQNQKLILYHGNYSAYERLKALKLQEMQKIHHQQQKRISQLSLWINRFRSKATKAKQVQSRIKFLEKMQSVELVRQDSPFQFQFLRPLPAGNPLLRTSNLKIGYDKNHVLIEQINFSISERDRIGILGINGIGKTTFIKTLMCIIPALNGTITKHPRLRVGYFDQQAIDYLDSMLSPFAYLTQNNSETMTELQVRTFLGHFGFTGNQIFEPIQPFSGGEKTRLVLARLISERPNLLILDEPTNHLDLEMRESLAYALQSYEGALILIAHDQYLLKATIDQFYQIKNRRLSPCNDPLDYYYQLPKN